MTCESRFFRLVWIAALTAISLSAFAQEARPLDDAASCQKFAQEFYRWYIPIYEGHPSERRAADVAIQRKGKAFDPVLLQALNVDFAAQRKSNEIDGIDFDPFVGGDGGEDYEVRKVSLKGEVCYAEVWQKPSSDDSWKPNGPDVVAEISKQVGKWKFKNFSYRNGNDDLLSALEWWRKERTKQK
jgi:hypothetical protein